jgi:hypothetical protein
MAVVVMHAVASMDGYIADTDDEVGPLFEWYFNGDVEIVAGGPFKVSKASADYVRSRWQSIETTVIGRHLFDLTNGWEGRLATSRRASGRGVTSVEAGRVAPGSFVSLLR